MTNSNDLNTAKGLRDNGGRSLAVVRDGKVLYESQSFGIFPLYSAYVNKMDFENACAADKVIGKGAAIFFEKLNLKKIDTVIISKPALEYLQNHDVVVTYTKLVDYIANRTNDGKCPVETMAETHLDFDAFLDGVEQFLKRLEII